MNLTRRYQWVRLAQLIITFGLIAVLFRQISLADILPVVIGTHWKFQLLSLSLLLICHLLNVARWHYILQVPAISYGKLLTVYGASLFGGTFLPSGLGADSIRAVLVSRDVSLKRALFSVGFDRLVATFSLSAILIIGLLLGTPTELTLGKFGATLPGTLLILAGILLAVGALSLIMLAFWRRTPDLRRRLEQFLATLILSMRASPNAGSLKRVLSVGSLLAVCSQLCLVAAYWMALQALNIQSPLGASFWLVLIGSASLLLPISVNGLGLQEGIYVVLLASYAVPSTVALAFGIIVRMQILLFALIGGLLSLGWNVRHMPNRI